MGRVDGPSRVLAFLCGAAFLGFGAFIVGAWVQRSWVDEAIDRQHVTVVGRVTRVLSPVSRRSHRVYYAYDFDGHTFTGNTYLDDVASLEATKQVELQVSSAYPAQARVVGQRLYKSSGGNELFVLLFCSPGLLLMWAAIRGRGFASRPAETHPDRAARHGHRSR